MCKFYSLRVGPDELRKFFEAEDNQLSNLELRSRTFPNTLAPVLALASDRHRLALRIVARGRKGG